MAIIADVWSFFHISAFLCAQTREILRNEGVLENATCISNAAYLTYETAQVEPQPTGYG